MRAKKHSRPIVRARRSGPADPPRMRDTDAHVRRVHIPTGLAVSRGSKFEQLPGERKAGPGARARADGGERDGVCVRASEAYNTQRGQKPKKKKRNNDEKQGVGGDGEVCGSERSCVRKTKRYRRRVKGARWHGTYEKGAASGGGGDVAMGAITARVFRVSTFQFASTRVHLSREKS